MPSSISRSIQLLLWSIALVEPSDDSRINACENPSPEGHQEIQAYGLGPRKDPVQIPEFIDNFHHQPEGIPEGGVPEDFIREGDIAAQNQIRLIQEAERGAQNQIQYVPEWANFDASVFSKDFRALVQRGFNKPEKSEQNIRSFFMGWIDHRDLPYFGYTLLFGAIAVGVWLLYANEEADHMQQKDEQEASHIEKNP